MSGRHNTELRFRFHGDPALARAYIGEARKYVAAVGHRRQGIGDGASLSQALTNSDGVVFRVLWSGGQPLVEIDVRGVAGGAMEEVIYLYISSPGGLRIFDLGEKRLVKTITGLHSFEVFGVSDDLRIVHMIGAGVAVRVDLETMAAFSYADYPSIVWDTDSAPDAYSTHKAWPAEGKVSPDGTRFLMSYDITYEAGSGGSVLVLEGLGGFLLANATTLAPIRSAIRMSERQQISAWAPDSQKFYLSTKTNVDGNGNPPHDPWVYEMPTDYVCVFDRDGALLGSRLITAWVTPPVAGLRSTIEWIEPSRDGSKVYVVTSGSLGEFAGAELTVLDATDNTLPILSVTPLTASFSLTAGQAALSNDGNRLAIRATQTAAPTNIIIEMDVAQNPPVETQRHASAAFNSYVLGTAEYYPRTLTEGPKSRYGGPDDKRWFFFTTNPTEKAVIRAYRDISKPSYEYDIADVVAPGAFTTKYNYALKSAGVRPKRKAA